MNISKENIIVEHDELIISKYVNNNSFIVNNSAHIIKPRYILKLVYFLFKLLLLKKIMKQAILIVAYKDLDYLGSIVDYFAGDDYLFFIHLNSLSKFNEQDLVALRDRKNVQLVMQKYATRWGSLNHLKAILYLCSEAIKYEVSYVHLISGQDFPIKTGREIQEVLKNNIDKEFIEYFPLPAKVWADENGGFDRIEYYHFYDFISSSSWFGRLILKTTFIAQKFLGIKRKINPALTSKLYGGGTWWTLSKNCLAFVLNEIESNKDFLDMLAYSKIPEEILFQTIIMNSPYREKVVNENLRYIEWEWKNGSRPAILDESDFDKLRASNAFFARKFIFPTSLKLAKALSEPRID